MPDRKEDRQLTQQLRAYIKNLHTSYQQAGDLQILLAAVEQIAGVATLPEAPEEQVAPLDRDDLHLVCWEAVGV